MPALVRLDASTGHLFWLSRPESAFSGRRHALRWNTRYAGTEALGTFTEDGYKRGKIDARRFWAHRVVWALVHGEWPDGEVDHINGDPADNRPENLRCVAATVNCRNQKLRTSNTSGVMGVSWNRRRQGWIVRINTDAGRVFLGKFDCFDSAVAARKDAEREHEYHRGHGAR